MGRRHRERMLAGAASVAIVLALGAMAANLLRGAELSVIDTHFSLRGSQGPPPEVVVVAIDDVTFSDLRRPFPFPRRLHARVIDRLRAAGAKVIAYDVQFTEATTVRDDNALIEAVGRAGNVVLATDELDAHGRVAVLGGPAVLAQVGARAADTSVRADADGVYRRLAYSLQPPLKTLPVVVAERATGRPVARSAFGSGSVPIDFAGPPGTVRTVSFSRVLNGEVAPSAFRGKIVVVGATAPTLKDLHLTAASPGVPMAGPELEANAIVSVLHGLPLRHVPGWIAVLIVAALGAVVPLANVRLRSWRIFALGVGLAGAYAVTTQVVFDAGRILPFAYPMLGLGLATIATLGVDYAFASFEQQRVRDMFSRFVPEDVVDQVLSRAGDTVRLGGERRVCTVMFCDLRGFTSFSQRLPADRVIDVVNVYLAEMSDAILACGGTVVAYMGDGIMGLFGAPLPQDDHADRALRAARDMMGPRLERFNAWLAEHGLERRFRMGIGLNSGEVMAGNVGSERRVEYTAIGDTTNTASRLEGLTKTADGMLLVADSTVQLLQEPPGDLVAVGEVEVRGRDTKLRVWSLPDPPGAPPRDSVASAPGSVAPTDASPHVSA